MLAVATLIVARQQRTQAHLDWMRDQVARLVVELEADHDRMRTPSVGLEVNGQERKYLDPRVPIWGLPIPPPAGCQVAEPAAPCRGRLGL